MMRLVNVVIVWGEGRCLMLWGGRVGLIHVSSEGGGKLMMMIVVLGFPILNWFVEVGSGVLKAYNFVVPERFIQC